MDSTTQLPGISFTFPDARRQRYTLVPPNEAAATAVPTEPADVSPVDEVGHRETTYRRTLILADAVAATAAVLCAELLSERHPTPLLFIPAIVAVLVAKIQGLYDRDDVVIRKSSLEEWRTLVQAAAMTSVVDYLAWRAISDATRGGGVRLLVFLFIVTFAFSFAARVLARGVARRVTADERIVIIGNPSRCLQLARNLLDLPGVDLIGTIPSGNLEGSREELSAIVTHLHAHRLVIAPDRDQTDRATLELIRSAKSLGVRVSLMPTIMTVVGGRATFDDVHGQTLLGVPRFGLSRSSCLLKRAFDIVGASVAAVVALPVLVVLGIVVKLDSRGPALFRQTRVGRDGRHFKILKLRTMVADADALKAELRRHNEAEEGLFKMADDPRITRVGHALRALHIDELPQVFNVLAGDMSLVGPRPLVVEEDSLLRSSGSERLRLTPGITGPWQIRGPMNASLTEMARLDYLYISSWSIWRDVDILIRTAQRVLDRGGD